MAVCSLAVGTAQLLVGLQAAAVEGHLGSFSRQLVQSALCPERGGEETFAACACPVPRHRLWIGSVLFFTTQTLQLHIFNR